MAAIDNLLVALDERQIVERVTRRHDDFRVSYSLHSNTVDGFDEFSGLVADYYGQHFSRCVSAGGTLPRSEAAGRAKEILEREYRRRNGDIVAAFNDAHDGTNGGLRAQLDLIAEALKTESVERYIREMFDRHVAPNSWQDKVEIIRQFISRCGANLASSIRADQPTRYAQNYRELIHSYVMSLQRTSPISAVTEVCRTFNSSSTAAGSSAIPETRSSNGSPAERMGPPRRWKRSPPRVAVSLSIHSPEVVADLDSADI